MVKAKSKNKVFTLFLLGFLALAFISTFIQVPVVNAVSYNYTMDVSGSEYQMKNSGGTIVYQSGSSSSTFNTMMSDCASGYNVYIYAGSYTVDSTWNIYVNSVTVTFASTLSTSPNANGNLVGSGTPGAVLTNTVQSMPMMWLYGNNIVVSGVTMNGNGLNQSPSPTTYLGTGVGGGDLFAIAIQGNNCLIEYSTIYNVRVYGVWMLFGAANCGVQNCKIYDVGANGLMSGNTDNNGPGSTSGYTTSNSFFVNNEVYACSDVGIDNYGCSNLIITGNYIYNCNPSSCTMYGFANSYEGIDNEFGGGTGSGSYALIADNLVTNCAGDDIFVCSSGASDSGAVPTNYILICGNAVSLCDRFGIGIADCVSATGNIIDFNTVSTSGTGIYLDSSAINTNVYGNTYGSGNGANYSNGGQGTTTTQPTSGNGIPVAVTVTSSPVGSGFITANGSAGYAGSYSTSPYTFYATVGNSVTLVANTVAGYTFTSWSPSGAQTHSITVPSSNPTYTATYTQGSPTPTPTITPTPPVVTPTPTPTPTPVPTVTLVPTASPAPTPTPDPSLDFLITQNTFLLNYTTGQSFAVQSLNPASTITFTVTSGTLNGTGTVTASDTGGNFQIIPTTSGTLLVTTTGAAASVYIDGVYANNIPYNFFPGDPTITWGYGNTPIIITGNGVQYFFRSDTYTTLGVQGYGFDSDYTNTYQTVNETYSGYNTVNYAFQVYLFSNPTHSTELTSGPSASIAVSGNYAGQDSGTFNMPLSSVTLGYQALQISVEEQYNGGSWATERNYISPVLITDSIKASTWTFTLYINQNQTGGNTYTAFTFGNSQYQSGVSNIVFSTPNESEIQAWRLSRIDIVGFEIASYTDEIGSAFYALVLLLFAATLYFRYGHASTITFFFVLFGGSGGLLFVFFSNAMWIVAPVAALIILGTTAMVWRIIR